MTETLRRELKHGEVKVLKKLFTRIKKKKERRAALVIGKMPKLGNNYNLLREACYEASLLTLFFCRQINKIPLCLEQVFSVIDPEDVKISSAHVPKQILKTPNRQTAKKKPTGKL